MNYLDSKLHHLEQYRHYRYPSLDERSAPSSSYGLMLPKHQGDLNLLEPYRERLSTSSWLRSLPEKEKRNLSSSLIMLANFMYPLYVENNLTTLLRVLGYRYNRPELVKMRFLPTMSRLELYTDSTRFDAAIQVRKNKSLFIKALYTERSFGKETSNPLSEHDFMEFALPKLTMLKSSFRNYQFYLKKPDLLHYLINVEKGSDILFLLPVENKGLWNFINTLSEGLDNDYMEQHILIWSWEEVIAKLLDTQISVLHALQYEELLKKYDLSLWD